MGLDGVEIVMEVEDHFGITIPDSQSAAVRTVQDLLDIINSRVNAAANVVCPTLPAFLTVRREVREFVQQPDLRLRPSTAIADVIPWSRRVEFWGRIAELVGTQRPALRRPKWLRNTLLNVSLVVTLYALALCDFDPVILPLGVLSAAFVIGLLHLVTRPFRLSPPDSLATLGQFSRQFAGVTTALKPIDSPEAVFADLRKIIVDALGVNPDEVVPTARFVEDLDMN